MSSVTEAESGDLEVVYYSLVLKKFDPISPMELTILHAH